MAKNKVLTEKTDINTPFSEFVRKFKKQKTAMVAMVFLVFLVVLAFISYKIAPYGINEYDYSAIMQPPTAAHLFGTDEFGRDLFSRVICGTRISLSVGLFAVTVGMIVGTIMGLLAGYYGGIIDSIIMRICDVLLAFPGLILAIAIVAILGSGLYNVVIAVAVFNIPKFARLVRGNTLETKNSVFVQAARNIGAGDMRILFKHILPSAAISIIPGLPYLFGVSAAQFGKLPAKTGIVGVDAGGGFCFVIQHDSFPLGSGQLHRSTSCPRGGFSGASRPLAASSRHWFRASSTEGLGGSLLMIPSIWL